MDLEPLAGSLILYVSHFPSDGQFDVKYCEKNAKSRNYDLKDGSRLSVLLHGPVPDFFCPRNRAYCKIENRISILTLKTAIEFLNRLIRDDRQQASNTTEYSEEDLKNGITVENEGTLRGVLRELLARKRWNLVRTFGKIITTYHRYLENFYAPSQPGYEAARVNYGNLAADQLAAREMFLYATSIT